RVSGGSAVGPTDRALNFLDVFTRVAHRNPDAVARRLSSSAPNPIDLHGGGMFRRAYAQRSVFEVLLPDGDKLWDAEPRAIDEILDDEDVVDLVDAAWHASHGRPPHAQRHSARLRARPAEPSCRARLGGHRSDAQ